MVSYDKSIVTLALEVVSRVRAELGSQYKPGWTVSRIVDSLNVVTELPEIASMLSARKRRSSDVEVKDSRNFRPTVVHASPELPRSLYSKTDRAKSRKIHFPVDGH